MLIEKKVEKGKSKKNYENKWERKKTSILNYINQNLNKNKHFYTVRIIIKLAKITSTLFLA